MEPQQMEEEGKMGDVGEVGFKKPPVHSRFRKGCSGNSKGRPKGTKNLRTDLNEVLQERITITEGDRKVRMSKQRAIVMTLVAKTLKGDSRSCQYASQHDVPRSWFRGCGRKCRATARCQ